MKGYFSRSDIKGNTIVAVTIFDGSTPSAQFDQCMYRELWPPIKYRRRWWQFWRPKAPKRIVGKLPELGAGFSNWGNLENTFNFSQDICKRCGIELVSDTCDNCGTDNAQAKKEKPQSP